MFSASKCRQKHDVKRTSEDIRGTGWECSECGETWVHEEFYCADADDIGYCFERLHEAPQSEKSDPDEED